MIPRIAVLNPVEHRDLRVDAKPSALRGDAQRFVQVAVGEFPLLAIQCPILVSKDSDTGAFFCGAMLGFDEGENLFLRADGEYDGYRPLNLQRSPFYVSDGRLAIDLDSPRLGAERGESLFDEAGAPTEYLNGVKWTLETLRPGLEMTSAFLETLVRLQLLAPMEVELSFDDGTDRRLEGLYTINQETFRDLADEVVLHLFRQGALYLIHLMILSVKQIARLAERKNARLSDPAEPFGLQAAF